MTTWTEWFQHAFAVNASEDELTAQQQAVVHAVARDLVRRRLTVPALAFLKMSEPLNYVGAQTLHMFGPALSVFSPAVDKEDALDNPALASALTVLTTTRERETFAEFLERRDSLEILTSVIEDLEKQATLQDEKQTQAPK